MAILAFLLFAGIENALSELVEDRLGMPPFIGSVLAGGLVAGVLAPLKARLDKLAKPADRKAPLDGSPVNA